MTRQHEPADTPDGHHYNATDIEAAIYDALTDPETYADEGINLPTIERLTYAAGLRLRTPAGHEFLVTIRRTN
jgi:hypothetical protein